MRIGSQARADLRLDSASDGRHRGHRPRDRASARRPRREADPDGSPRRCARAPGRRARRAARWRSTSPSAPRWRACWARPARSTSSSPTPRCRRSGALEDFSVQEIDRALDVNLRAPIVLAHAPRAAHGRARAAATSSSSPRSRARRRRRTRRSTTRPSSACAASRPRCAPTCATAASASRRCSPASSATPACSPRPSVKLPPGVGTRTPGGGRRRRRQRRSSATAARSTSRRCRCASARSSRASRRRRPDAFARRIGSDDISRQMAEGQREKR